MSGAPRLLADIGGTNARFALGGEAAPEPPIRIAVAEHPSALGAIHDAVRRLAPRVGVSGVAIAAAGPVEGGRVRLTNAPWTIDAAEIGAALGVPVRVVNDLEAVALALPRLGPGDADPIRPGRAEGPMLAVNLGTGFGAAVALPPDPPARALWSALAAEPGHMRLAERLGDLATLEDALSGPGIARLHRLTRGVEAAPDAIVAAAAAGEAGARATLARLCEILAAAMVDLVLTTGAWGGVWLTGGVLDRIAEAAPNGLDDAVAGAFARPGPMAGRLAAVPVRRIRRADPALLGLWGLPLGARPRRA